MQTPPSRRAPEPHSLSSLTPPVDCSSPSAALAIFTLQLARCIVPVHPTLRSHPHHQHSAMTALCNHCIMQSPPCSTSSSLTRRSHPTATTLKNQQANKPTSREAGKPESWRVHHQYRAGCRPPVMVIAQCSHCILPSLHNAITPPPPVRPRSTACACL